MRIKDITVRDIGKGKNWLWLGILLALLVAGCSTGYQRKEASFVFVTWDEGRGRLEHPIDGIDPDTFQVLNQQGHAKDKRHAYFKGVRLQVADASSLVALSDMYAKDSGRVYFGYDVIAQADPATFILLGAWWGQDKSDIYLQKSGIKACDPKTFVLLRDGWQRDSQCVYNGSKKLPGADPASFVVINSWYAKDKRQAYLSDAKVIDGADPETFGLRSGGCIVCAKDRNRCYRYEKVVSC